MKTDKQYCMSSYLAFRYLEREDVNFFDGMKHENFKPVADERRVLVQRADSM